MIFFLFLPGRQNYRLFVIYKIPTLKVLDFQKVKQSERERAQRLASSAAGAAMEADARMEARAAAAAAADGAIASGAYANNEHHGEDGTNTFEPGEGKSAEESFATQFTVEEKAKIREMVANAASADEIDRIENLVKRGIFPGTSQSAIDKNGGGNGIVPPPPLPPSDRGNRENEEGDEEGDNSKRQRTE
jgi:U2 small nuclear ribonucleoprotein A'